MDVNEHFYNDDPDRGPADVRTRLDDTDYFFLGNGRVQAAVQVCTSGAGTAVGLVILDPERLGPKRAALTMDKAVGLQNTLLRVSVGGGEFLHPDRKTVPMAFWGRRGAIPTVTVIWNAGRETVKETFYCPDRATPRIAREVRVSARSRPRRGVRLRTGTRDGLIERKIALDGSGTGRAGIVYTVEHGSGGARVETAWCDEIEADDGAERYWSGLTECIFPEVGLRHLFNASRCQLPAVISGTGAVDGSIWQYNLEWVRDQAMVVRGLVLLGDFAAARTMLDRLLSEFVTEAGDTIDSGERRNADDVELDQNGLLLSAVRTYVDWSGDREIIDRHWRKIRAAADFPLSAPFLHEPSGLLHNTRDFWERHAAHGIEDGLELAYQLFVSIGLGDAASLAALVGRTGDAERWSAAARRIREAMLGHDRFSLVDKGRLVKRRRVTGTIQREAACPPDSGLPPSVPLLRPGPNYLDPDTVTALPVALGFIDPRSGLARRTLESLETLWNQDWRGGGYGRYNATSEADAPGAWPFASLFMARAHLEAGDGDRARRVLDWLGSIPGARAGTWYEMYGPRQAPPFPQVGFPPWTWSELVVFFIHHLFGVRPDTEGVTIRPRLLPGLEYATALLRVGDHRLNVTFRRAKPWEKSGFRVDGKQATRGESLLRLPPLEGDRRVVAAIRDPS